MTLLNNFSHRQLKITLSLSAALCSVPPSSSLSSKGNEARVRVVFSLAELESHNHQTPNTTYA